jgi:alginate O-acetyltransferase complex protein AlgI
MVFSSLLFVLKFLPIALFLMWITPKKYRNGMLLLLSLIFYTWGEVRYVFIMFLSIAIDYCASNGIENHRTDPSKTKLYLMVSVCGNLGLLFFFKYTDFAISLINGAFKTTIPLLNLTLPLGISFYTFQTMSYTIDVYRGHLKADRNLIDFGAFVCLFPQLIAGPIVTYGQIAKELKERTVNLDKFGEGVRIFISGLACKLLLANNIGLLWDDVALLGPSRISSPLAWLGLIAFGFQIYFDFSGYSLMAIGMGKMMGFEFPDNFNYPYISRSMTEFWKRWHMTLGYWFREYVYIPLGGNRKGFKRQIFNLFIVWFLTGLWHGASVNFILWGLYFFVLLALEKWFLLKWLDRHPVYSRFYFIFGILIGWAIFAITDLGVLSAYLVRLFTFTQGSDVLYYLRNYGFILIACFLFSTPFTLKLKEVRFAVPVLKLATGLLFVVSIAYLVDSSYNPFLYFRF